MNIRSIKTEMDYEWALQEIEPYFAREPEPGSPEAERFDVLATLIEAMRRNIGRSRRRTRSPRLWRRWNACPSSNRTWRLWLGHAPVPRKFWPASAL